MKVNGISCQVGQAMILRTPEVEASVESFGGTPAGSSSLYTVAVAASGATGSVIRLFDGEDCSVASSGVVRIGRAPSLAADGVSAAEILAPKSMGRERLAASSEGVIGAPLSNSLVNAPSLAAAGELLLNEGIAVALQCWLLEHLNAKSI